MEDSFIPTPEETPFEEVLKALLNRDEVLDPLYLYRLSDINQENLSALLKIWMDIHVDRRRALLEDLEELTDTNTLVSFEPIFRLALKDEDEQVRFFAIRAIEVFDTDDLIPFFLSVLADEQSVDLRAVAASVLGKYVYRGELDKIEKDQQIEIEDKLLEILEGDHPLEIQRRALEALSYSSREGVRDLILKAYQSDLEEWIASALFAMGRSYDYENYGDLVMDKLQHTSPKVRLEAVRACGELVLEDAVPTIVDLLHDLPDIRAAAIWALAEIGGEDAGLAIQDLMDGEVSPDEEELLQQAMDRLDFLEDGMDMALFDFDYDKEDEYLLDDYDYQQDGYDDDFDDDDFDLDDFDIDDDQWLE
jgi:HEAT repeat protein